VAKRSSGGAPLASLEDDATTIRVPAQRQASSSRFAELDVRFRRLPKPARQLLISSLFALAMSIAFAGRVLSKEAQSHKGMLTILPAEPRARAVGPILAPVPPTTSSAKSASAAISSP
jgi:hypothetical protein